MWRAWVGFKKGVVQAGQVFVYVVGASAVVVVVVVVLALKGGTGLLDGASNKEASRFSQRGFREGGLLEGASRRGLLEGSSRRGASKRAPATYTKTCPRPPERGQCQGRKNLKQRRSPLGWGLKKRSGGKLEGKCGVRGRILRRG